MVRHNRMSEQEQRDAWRALGVRTDIPYPALVDNHLPCGPGVSWSRGPSVSRLVFASGGFSGAVDR
jgi:hypothetical protein